MMSLIKLDKYSRHLQNDVYGFTVRKKKNWTYSLAQQAVKFDICHWILNAILVKNKQMALELQILN